MTGIYSVSSAHFKTAFVGKSTNTAVILRVLRSELKKNTYSSGMYKQLQRDFTVKPDSFFFQAYPCQKDDSDKLLSQISTDFLNQGFKLYHFFIPTTGEENPNLIECPPNLQKLVTRLIDAIKANPDLKEQISDALDRM